MSGNNPRTSSHVILARKIFPSLMKVEQKPSFGKIYLESVNDGIRTAFYLLKKESVPMVPSDIAYHQCKWERVYLFKK